MRKARISGFGVPCFPRASAVIEFRLVQRRLRKCKGTASDQPIGARGALDHAGCPFAVFMARDGGEWTLRSLKATGLAFK
jgi:hypothetical protein